MFDVSWTDPTSETVGQHRQKKERDAGKSSQGSSRSSVKSSSTSSASLATQSTSKFGWSLFRGGSSKKGTQKTKENQPPQTPTEPPKNLVLAAYSEDSIKEEAPQEVVTRIQSQPQEYDKHRQSVASCPNTPRDSVFSSPPTYRSSNTDSLWGSVSEASSRPLSNNTFSSAPGRSSFYQDDNSLNKLISDVSLSPTDDDFTIANKTQFPRIPSKSSKRRLRNTVPKLPPQPNSPPPLNRPLPEPPRPENTVMRQRIRRMEAANSKIILERLKEEWDDVTDGTIYNELEFEKQLWLLVGLRYLIKDASGDGRQSESRGAKSPTLPCADSISVLSLYENLACASLLSTIYPIGSKTHHLSLNQLSSLEQTSHIRTLIVNTPIPNLPYAPSTFKAINSLRLPVLLPSSSIPSLLQHCNRILTLNGVLNLSIMDPSPKASTLGPKMKAWLEDYLLLKLETQFRCLKPTRIMPIWLQEAGFKISSTMEPSEHSLNESQESPFTTMNLSFPAIARGERGNDGESTKNDKKKEEMDILASTIGRMLWREIYGSFVVGKKWWWEDEEIVEEANSLGTTWDVSIIQAVKG